MSRYLLTAIIYDKHGMKLAEEHNSYIKTHPLQKFYATKVGTPKREYLHAEVRAIIKALKRGIPYKILISRINPKNGNTGLAKPCPICELAIKDAGIKRIEYTL